ncbi:hypothetical protein [Sphingobium sp. CCH11-B1]|uniref:hypothetical protein n=1 Tax=Sphingobium sp. CCH11-B1 TaxID=1768781 RepID=UPI00082C432F|nr:hypothetical protein [Sphingobium sp. CCH11-B1]
MAARHYTTWTDQRLAEAYDLIADVVRDHSTSDDKLPEIARLLPEIDTADEMLAGILYERRVS